MTDPASQEEKTVAAAAALIHEHYFYIVNQDEMPTPELIARLLLSRDMLTSQGQRQQELDNLLALQQTFYRKAVADVKRMTRYIGTLQRIVNALLGQIDAVAALSAVTKTRKGRQLVEQGQAARRLYDEATATLDEAGRARQSDGAA